MALSVKADETAPVPANMSSIPIFAANFLGSSLFPFVIHGFVFIFFSDHLYNLAKSFFLSLPLDCTGGF